MSRDARTTETAPAPSGGDPPGVRAGGRRFRSGPGPSAPHGALVDESIEADDAIAPLED